MAAPTRAGRQPDRPPPNPGRQQPRRRLHIHHLPRRTGRTILTLRSLWSLRRREPSGTSALIAIVGLAWMLGTSQTAAAQSNSAPPEKRTQPVNGAQANKLFLDGVAAKTKGDIREACASFEASQELDSNPATRVYMAWCLEQEGHKATAWGLYQRFVAEMSNKPDSNAEAKRLREFAIREMDRIQPSLSYLTIKVPAESEIDGLEVRCGSEVISAGTWNHALPM